MPDDPDEMDLTTLRIELDSAWQYGAAQERNASYYRDSSQRHSAALRREYPNSAFRIATENTLALHDVGRISAEAALEAIRDEIGTYKERVKSIDEQARAANR